MGLDLLNIHRMVRDEATNQMVVVGKNPLTRFIMQGETPVNCQKGKFYTDGGDPIPEDKVPLWVWKQAAKMSLEGRQNIGLILPSESVKEEVQEVKVHPVKRKERQLLSVVDAIYELDHANDEHWTKGGFPNLRELRRKTGRNISRGEAEEAAPDYRRKES